ncbi:uncharacterized protein PV09_06190 [Verruconis gallopava]|uniref:GTP-binding protein 8 n=1 Tax=Verruconis gallopava TaxID=253628 RepID=A0A0D2A6L1_9PEZI|nr:uncharacterized protein PV09_06190 [Verruconis gallopava]KIW02368.1 hypothetical protein PV09_06190 [Verruconis gallopava]
MHIRTQMHRGHAIIENLSRARCMSTSTSSTALASHVLNSYTTAAPSLQDLDRANRYFTNGPVAFLFSASKLPNIPIDSKIPEIAFLGRSNVGKSSLLNALLNKKNAKIAHESKHPGRTKTMNFFGVGPAAEVPGTRRVAKKGQSLEMLEKAGSKELKKGTEVRNVIGQGGGIVVVDCPGYGFGSKEAWGDVVIRYLQKRKQLAIAYLLVDINVGLKKSDEQTLELLREANTPHQIILSKVDKVLFPSGKLDMERLSQRIERLDDMRRNFKTKVLDQFAGTSLCTDILCTSSNNLPLGKYKRIGIEELQYAALHTAGLFGEGKEIDNYEKERELSEYHGIVSWDQLGDLNTAIKS